MQRDLLSNPFCTGTLRPYCFSWDGKSLCIRNPVSGRFVLAGMASPFCTGTMCPFCFNWDGSSLLHRNPVSACFSWDRVPLHWGICFSHHPLTINFFYVALFPYWANLLTYPCYITLEAPLSCYCAYCQHARMLT